MIKRILILGLFICHFNLTRSFAQEAISYFAPSTNYNTAEYQDQTQAGAKMNIVRQVLYNIKSDKVELTEVLLSSNKPINTSVSVHKITSKEVYKISVNVGDGMKYFPQPICILKVPPKNGSASWIIDDGSEKETNVSSWTIVEYLSQKRPAIKVVKKVGNQSNYSIDYYVENVGLWRTEIVAKNKSIVMDRLQRLFFSNFAETNQISKYEERLFSNSFKSEEGVSIREKDFRMISWSTTLNNASSYTREKIEKMGFEYIKIEDNDRAHITYAYRNCSKNIIFKVTEWYDLKISFHLEWFSNDVKKSIPSFFWCEN